MIADYIFDDEKQLHAELIQIDVDGKKARLRRKSAKLLNKIFPIASTWCVPSLAHPNQALMRTVEMDDNRRKRQGLIVP